METFLGDSDKKKERWIGRSMGAEEKITMHVAEHDLHSRSENLPKRWNSTKNFPYLWSPCDQRDESI